MSDPMEYLCKSLSYEDGKLLHYGKRMLLIPFSWLINLQKEIENILGPDGAYVLIKNASYKGGLEMAKDIERFFKDLPPEQKIAAFLKLGNITGWGKLSLEKFQLDPLEVVIKSEHSYVEGAYEGESEGKCYFSSLVTSAVEQYVKNVGNIDYEIETVETKCIAMGDPYCELVIRKA